MSSRKLRRNLAKRQKKEVQAAIAEYPCSIEGCTSKSKTKHECQAVGCEGIEWYNCTKHYPHVLKLIKEHVAEVHPDVARNAPNAALWNLPEAS